MRHEVKPPIAFVQPIVPLLELVSMVRPRLAITGLFGLLGLMAFSLQARCGDFYDEIEKTFVLRSLGQLQITNLRGGIVVHGWSQDKIRVKARRRASAANPEEAKRLFSALDFRYREIDGDIELSAEYGRGLEIQDRLHERKQPRTSMEMTVWAPARLGLQVWSSEGQASVSAWNAPVAVRTSSGTIRIENIKGDSVSLLCPNCAMMATAIKGSLRCMGGAQQVQLSNVNGGNVYVETTAGPIDLLNVSGEQLYVSKSGMLKGRRLRGRFEFHLQGGGIDVADSSGFASGYTESGDISLKMSEWQFADKALIESVTGNISISLPTNFSGDVDLWSVMGKTESSFTVRSVVEERVYGTEPANHLRGRIGSGGEQLRVFSRGGSVKVMKVM
jgi:hypothetical protein